MVDRIESQRFKRIVRSKCCRWTFYLSESGIPFRILNWRIDKKLPDTGKSLACHHQGRIGNLCNRLMIKAPILASPGFSVTAASIHHHIISQILHMPKFSRKFIYLDAKLEKQGTIRFIAYHRINIIMQMSNATIVSCWYETGIGFLRKLPNDCPLVFLNITPRHL